jgi:hypothetical protein
MANPQPTWYFLDPAQGTLRLFSAEIPDSANNLWDVPNVLLQKFPAEEFTVTTKMIFYPNEKLKNEKAGLAIMGLSYATIALKNKDAEIYLIYSVCTDADKGGRETEKEIIKVKDDSIFLRVKITTGALCQFSYSFDGNTFTDTGEKFSAETGKWIGAKVGIFCTREAQTNDSGYADFDWFRVDK